MELSIDSLGGPSSRTTMSSAKGGQSHVKTVRGTHQVFTGGKPLPTVEAVQDALRNEGVI